jgi:hypothetical protein
LLQRLLGWQRLRLRRWQCLKLLQRQRLSLLLLLLLLKLAQAGDLLLLVAQSHRQPSDLTHSHKTDL